MRILLFIGGLAAVLLVALALLNGQNIGAIGTMSLGVADVQAPLALVAIVLGIVAIVSLASYLAVQAIVGARLRRHNAKVLEAQRLLAEQAEASRFNELRVSLMAEFARLATTLTATQDALRVEIHDSGNSLAAMLAEIDDRARPHANAGRVVP